MRAATYISREIRARGLDIAVIGVPKTIDNDLPFTDQSFGFQSAFARATEFISAVAVEASASPNGVGLVKLMGRHSGWIAAYGGIAGGADVILVPERPFRLTRVCDLLQARQQQGSAFSIIVIAEDARPVPEENFLTEEECQRIYRHERLGGIGDVLAREIERCTNIQARVTRLGYVQRGGSPTSFDRVLATRFGVKAYEMAAAGEWGSMAALQGNRIISVPLAVLLLDEKIGQREIVGIILALASVVALSIESPQRPTASAQTQSQF